MEDDKMVKAWTVWKISIVYFESSGLGVECQFTAGKAVRHGKFQSSLPGVFFLPPPVFFILFPHLDPLFFGADNNFPASLVRKNSPIVGSR